MVKPFALKGVIDDKIGLTMRLSISGNKIEGTEINPHIYGEMIFDKDGQYISGG